MTQRRYRRDDHSSSKTDRSSAKVRRESPQLQSSSIGHTWRELRTSSRVDTSYTNLTRLIEQDAPLQHRSGLVLMYGPFQAEMQPNEERGVASWLRDCVGKHGLPSLVRYDYRNRAQVFRRDEFEPWLEPLIAKISS